MGANSPWPHDAKIIEFCGSGRPWGCELSPATAGQYLAVVRGSDARELLARSYPAMADRVVASQSRNAVRTNNADVLVLGGRSCLSAWRFRNLRHASHVALKLGLSIWLPVAVLACLVHVVLRRLTIRGVVRFDRTAQGSTLLVFAVRKRRLPQGARHYIPHRLGVSGFLADLMRQDVQHAVLRWFESLPALPSGEDLDLLVSDEHLPRVFALLESGPGVQPCDVYSTTGLPRSDFRSMPYFPPYLAEQLLSEARVHRGVCRVPSPRHHFLSLTYHALYHKGPSCGLPDKASAGNAQAAEHDYTAILSGMAASLGIDVEISRAGLEAYLAEQGWQPPRDMLLRLSKRNRWIREALAAEPPHVEDPGLVVFIARREVLNRGGLERLVPLLEGRGFSVLATKLLTSDETGDVAGKIRGGNWGRGPWKTSGGPPAAIVVAYDLHPTPLNYWQKRRFPYATNARVLEKSGLRDAFNEGFPEELHCNTLHSSDNSREAWEYIAIAMPGEERSVAEKIGALRAAYETRQPVHQDLTRYGVRAKIERIEHEGRSVIRKTFKPGCERYWEREAFAMGFLSRQVREIPPLLFAEGNTVMCPFYDDVLGYKRSSGKLIPLETAKAAIAALRRVNDAGYALIDASIDNVVIDRHEGLKLIDFEFLHRYAVPPRSFAESYDIAGCPADFTGDLPSGGAKNYRRNWQPYTGLSLESLLNDPVWLQHVKRTLYVLARPHRYFPRRVRHVYRQLAAGLQRHFSSRATMPARPGAPLAAPAANPSTRRAA